MLDVNEIYFMGFPFEYLTSNRRGSSADPVVSLSGGTVGVGVQAGEGGLDTHFVDLFHNKELLGSGGKAVEAR